MIINIYWFFFLIWRVVLSIQFRSQKLEKEIILNFKKLNIVYNWLWFIEIPVEYIWTKILLLCDILQWSPVPESSVPLANPYSRVWSQS